MSRVFIYVVDRDFGFAPNPYHGVCTLATCKPIIRRVSSINDWVIGMGGGRLKATGCVVYAMKITSKITFNEYWTNSSYSDKKPVRNGTKRMLVGDNIYYYEEENKTWFQADSHHSNHDGSTNNSNLINDTQTNSVLVSNHFYYFGNSAPKVPESILSNIKYQNRQGHRNYNLADCEDLINWIQNNYSECLNIVKFKPFDFDSNNSRYSAGTNKIT